MQDKRGRKIDYIRISVTDRCNLRCIYCMPEEGMPLLRHEDVLTFHEIERLCRVFVRLGITKVKLTGGEPLVRKDVEQLTGIICAIPGITSVTMTSNGLLLEEKMDALVKAGLTGMNVSIDTLNQDCYRTITRHDVLSQVKRGLEKALEYPHITLKINCVPLGMEEQNLTEVARLAKEQNIQVRFIEMMPVGMGRQFTLMTEAQILTILEKTFGKMEPVDAKLGNGPGHYYEAKGFLGKIGFISAVSHKFCDSCNRIRLTSAGFLKTCLQYKEGCDLRTPMRNGCTDEELEELIRKTIWNKPKEHHFLQDETGSEEEKAMSQIGG